MEIQSTKTQIHRHFSALLQPIWRERERVREQLPCKSHHTGTFSGVLCQLSAVMTPLHTVRSEIRIKGLPICCYYCFSPVCSKLQQKRCYCCCCFFSWCRCDDDWIPAAAADWDAQQRSKSTEEKEEAQAWGWLPLRRQRSASRRASQGQVKRNIGRRRKERENKSKQQANISFSPWLM